jgi:hypothetical protein
MRLQLVAAASLVLVAAPARADGTLAVRGVYYKERATRVVQPMLDAMFDAGVHGVVTGHFLVDAITSASASSGADNAKPFTERRYEGGGGYSHEIDWLTVGGSVGHRASRTTLVVRRTAPGRAQPEEHRALVSSATSDHRRAAGRSCRACAAAPTSRPSTNPSPSTPPTAR